MTDKLIERKPRRRQWRFVLLAIAMGAAVLIAVLFFSARQDLGVTAPEASSEPSPEGSTLPRPDGEWVRRQAMLLTLERMFAEQDSEEIFANASDRAKNDLLEGGVLVEEDGRYWLETDPAAWTVAEGLGDDGLLPRHVDNAMNSLLWENEVTWCGYEAIGREFVSSYVNTYQDAFETQEQYLTSIADYVDCGTGEL
ncbi:hypothetical protein [Nocardiopsis synnemataformans]|uniref:hypothetical protein n=1 Tax=Nocardiopsis synnemataformans TaxID=61305 RepID=UPI003EC11A8E